MLTQASCLCGGVTYQLQGIVGYGRYCHCRNCRKFAASSPAAWGVVASSNLQITSGETLLQKYDSGGGLRVFCQQCGSPLWFEPADAPQMLGIPLGVIDSNETPRPLMHVHTDSSAPWVQVEDDLPKFATYPDGSS